MLAANVSAADFLQQSGQGALYRVHEGPTAEKLTALREFFKGFGLHLQGGEKPSAKDYAALLRQIKPRPDRELLQTVMLRSLQQAQYSPENVGHFGLSYEGYTHFTSPIRRYPDLLVHRAIRAVLRKQRYQPAGFSWAALGEHCSMTERRADEASREVEQWLKCWYMRDRVGEELLGGEGRRQGGGTGALRAAGEEEEHERHRRSSPGGGPVGSPRAWMRRDTSPRC